MTMGQSKFIMVFIVFSIINFYVSYDSYLILLYRGDEYFEDDYIYGFYTI